MDQEELEQKIESFIQKKLKSGNPDVPERKIYLNHVMPKKNEKHGMIYIVEFKVINADVSKGEPFGGLWTFYVDDDNVMQVMKNIH